MSRSSERWWPARIRQFRRHLRARVDPAERAALEAWVPPGLLALFEAMPAADRRHGLNVVGALRATGHGDDRELLLAGLLHDAGKGPRVRLWQRVAWSLAGRYGAWVATLARLVPGGREGMERLAHHAERSAELAHAAGAPDRAVALIRGQVGPANAPALAALHSADEAS